MKARAIGADARRRNQHDWPGARSSSAARERRRGAEYAASQGNAAGRGRRARARRRPLIDESRDRRGGGPRGRGPRGVQTVRSATQNDARVTHPLSRRRRGDSSGLTWTAWREPKEPRRRAQRCSRRRCSIASCAARAPSTSRRASARFARRRHRRRRRAAIITTPPGRRWCRRRLRRGGAERDRQIVELPARGAQRRLRSNWRHKGRHRSARSSQSSTAYARRQLPCLVRQRTQNAGATSVRAATRRTSSSGGAERSFAGRCGEAVNRCAEAIAPLP